ncbi:putative PTS system, EIIA component [Streptococcus troglodytae]|uniref:Ascorbate-specific PTS system EIIA component n=1 Tax=Streptococcus troglodytae TaxID=1111760 RepID=A0A1L7LLP4_9STRE|nr:PTS sugar transporter subunit IIA [Streptococcus troglodytae]BAQ25079.1 putative PTS system, EIIA component [Streptococcus troglodytae]
MLGGLLTKEDIQFSSKDMNWEEAIRLAARPLLQKQKIEERYIQAMIDKVKDNGPFINIGDHLALPHARPEEGVLEKGLSLLKLDRPVNLLDDPKHPISVFICLAASDNNAHLEALMSLTKILSKKKICNN